MLSFTSLPELLLFTSLSAYGLASLSAFCVGVAKTGVPALGLIFTALMAAAVPGKEAIALVLILLITGDLFALRYYRHHADMGILKALLPSVLIGLLLGTAILCSLPGAWLKPSLAVLIFLLLGLELLRRSGVLTQLKQNRTFAWLIGAAVGVATVVGHAAGPVMSVYLVLSGADKHRFMGTSAWFFFVINVLKVPLMLLIAVMSASAALSALVVLPWTFAGALLGRRILTFIPDKVFNELVLLGALATALYLVWPL